MYYVVSTREAMDTVPSDPRHAAATTYLCCSPLVLQKSNIKLFSKIDGIFLHRKEHHGTTWYVPHVPHVPLAVLLVSQMGIPAA